MGISDLRKVCELYTPDNDFVEGNTAVIDGHNWLYKYITIISRYKITSEYRSKGETLPNLIGVPMGLRKFYKKNIDPVFVFDGGYNELKEKELNKRKDMKKKAEQEKKKAVEDNDEIKAAKMRARTQKITEDILNTTTDILDIMNIPYIIAPESADAQAAYMCNESDQIKYVISDDYDSILFGSPYTIRSFTSSERKDECLDLEKTKESNNITRKDLIRIAILCGTDYNDGIKGVGPKTSLKLVRKYDNMSEILKNENYEIPNYKDIRDIFLEPKIETNFSFNFEEKPDIDGLENYLCVEHDINKNTIQKSLEVISENVNQQKLDSF